MTKLKTSFFCQNCGAQSPKWLGKCPSCNEWNTYSEEVIQKSGKANGLENSYLFKEKRISKSKLITDISLSDNERIDTNNYELNRVLGGGLVPGSVILLGGEPGIGKSTLMLQIALNIKDIKVLYVSGEESEQQIKMRAERLNSGNNNCYILTETATQNIFRQTESVKPGLIIIDSIQTLHTDRIDSSAGSVSQIRECAAELQYFAKETSTPVFLVGHIIKDGTLAGPKILEHIVDTVLQFEGDSNHVYRILRAAKNRFGSTSELGIYEMHSAGLREVANPSEMLISHRDEPLSGIAVSATIEGMRPILIETQALVSSAAYGTPQRSSTGFDLRRLGMLLAVLEKKCGFRLGTKDVFLNIAGGIKVDDPAIDLGVIVAVLSSNEDMPVSSKVCFAAEIGLSGEIRPVSRIEQRIMEAEKLGFTQMYISRYNQKGLPDKYSGKTAKNHTIEIKPVGKVEDVFSLLF